MIHDRKIGRKQYSLPKVLARVISLTTRSEEHTSELQSLRHLVCRLLLEIRNVHITTQYTYTAHTQSCDSPNAAPVLNSEQLHTIKQTVITYLFANNNAADLLGLAYNAL